MVAIFKGKEIDKSKIEILKMIAYRRYTQEIYNGYFSGIEDVYDLAFLHDVNFDMENIAIGTDWFLCYTESEYFVQISEWVSIDNENKIQQVVEMMSTLKKIFLQNKEKLFTADMRHDTSYTMYLKMLQRGYFKEFSHEYIIDCAAPSQVQDLKIKFIDKFNNIEEFLANEFSNDYSEYFKYILHHLSFMISNKFIKKYSDSSADLQGQVLKKKK